MNERESQENASEPIDVQFHILFPASESCQAGIRSMFEVLNPVINRFPPKHLDTVLVLPRSEMPGMVNYLLTGEESQEGPYQPGTHAPDGQAVPIEEGESQRTCILLSQEAIEKLTEDRFLPRDTVSTVLEEYLHAWLYGLAWDRRGSSKANLDALSGCDQMLYEILAKGTDEYLVLRNKTILMGNEPLVDGEEGERITVGIMWAGDLNTILREGLFSMKRTIVGKSKSEKISVDDAWREVSTTLYRGFVEPLFRNAGALDAYLDPKPGDYLPASLKANEAVANFWSETHQQLQRTFKRPEETEDAMGEMILCLKEFLAKLGLKLIQDKPEGCYLRFESSFFDNLVF